uniref:TonB-dependent Receptor Plug Domain n=1 Tax=Candidatus Kentrum sp. FW TaxID=2126338 RepID=A0A450SUH3_9GAMM|nr:MAG: TonB-dependent Receptor Plug Domain [Candidatus Kentron sp. FW]
MKRKNILFRNSLHLALLGAALTLGAPGMAIADNASSDTQQDKNVPAGEPGDPIELDPIVAVGRMPASTTVLGREVDTPDNRRVQDVMKGMPNILDNAGANGLPTIRGIDGAAVAGLNQNMGTGNRPRVNTLVDGVARPFKGGTSVSASSLGFWDVETVEIGRGPQTTTTGRSSLTGAVQVSTRDPVHEFEAATRVGWFNERGTYEGALMFNVPMIKDQVALRFAAEYSDGEGYVDVIDHRLGDKINEDKYEHYRGKLLLTPDALPDTELVFSIDETNARMGNTPHMGEGEWDADDLILIDGTTTGYPKAWLYEKEQRIYSAKLLQGLGEKTDLEVRVSYLDNFFELDPRLHPAFQYEITTETTSAEALLHFEELGFIDKGVLGVAYEHEKDDVDNDVFNYDGSGKDNYWDLDGEKENFAIFGEIEAGLGGGWTAIIGGRFEWDERERYLDREWSTYARSKDGCVFR